MRTNWQDQLANAVAKMKGGDEPKKKPAGKAEPTSPNGHNGQRALPRGKGPGIEDATAGPPSGKAVAAPSISAQPPKIDPPKPRPPVALKKVGEFRPHPLLASDPQATAATRIRPRNAGIAGDLLGAGKQPRDEVDLIIGLDFGTSTVKAVIRDRFRKQSFAVPFTDAIDNPYLLPSRVYQSGGDYSLDSGKQARRDIKLLLLSCESGSPVGEFNDACGFLALVLRHCRGWLLDEHAALYRGVRINWSLNLGLPAASYENLDTVNLFRRLAWAAANLAAQQGAEITYENCEEFRRYSRETLPEYLKTGTSRSGFEFEFENVDVVPEVAAQIFGYVTSSKWDWRDRPMMMLVDIGAGTVDAAFFSYTNFDPRKRRFAFFANDVQPNGAMNLHRERVDWLRRAAAESQVQADVHDYLAAIKFPTDRTAPLPESVREYLPGYEVAREPGVEDIDEAFFRKRYYRQVATCCGDARRAGIPSIQMVNVPCFVTGGGSRLGIYSRIIEAINGNNTAITLQRLALTRISEDLRCPGLREADFDRLSVAYGLSHNGADGRPLGEYLRKIDVVRPAEPPTVDWRSNYIDKDMV